MPVKKRAKNIEHMFSVSLKEMKGFMRDFHSEMKKGLAGAESSLKMLPEYTKKPRGTESGIFLGLDLGGTHLRVMALALKGNRKTGASSVKTFVLGKKHITGRGRALFDFIAGCIKVFMKEYKLDTGAKHSVGFTFSFPVEKKGIASGVLLRWTKDFSASGVEGKDVVELLNASLKRKSLAGTKITALANDTVSTLMARSYEDGTCDMGVILGTGTNACYCENKRELINIEWGNFDKLRRTPYDKAVDRLSVNPGEQLLEKMVSGMYLGGIARLVAEDLIGKGKLPGDFKAEYMSLIESDNSKNMQKTKKLFAKLGVRDSGYSDRRLLKKACLMVSTRAARLAAVAIASVVTRMDARVSKKHTVAIDGSVYEKHPGFSRKIKQALKEIFGKNARNIKLVLTKNASARGAAILAATAAS